MLPPIRLLSSSLPRHSVSPTVSPENSNPTVKMPESSPDYHPLWPLSATGHPMHHTAGSDELTYCLSHKHCVLGDLKGRVAEPRACGLLLCTAWCRPPPALREGSSAPRALRNRRGAIPAPLPPQDSCGCHPAWKGRLEWAPPLGGDTIISMALATEAHPQWVPSALGQHVA